MRKFLRCLVLALAIFPFFSCADSDPDIVTVSGTMVFDYADEESFPAGRLAIFVQTASEVQRVESIVATHKQTGYTWRVSSPVVFKSGDKQWTCYTNLQSPEQTHIPNGQYECTYIDAAGEEVTATFVVNYAEKLFETKSADIKNVLTSSTDSLALYDKNGVLLFFGKKKSNWRVNANILRDYSHAVMLRHCLSSANNRAVCLLPPESLFESQNAEKTNSGEDDE
ncbi:MAG: hypothetical protein IJP62_10780 [Treponema sp.]|nr:hypothetical protein [Treponema sp.]